MTSAQLPVHCPRCQAPNQGEARFCAGCGAPMQSGAPPAPPPIDPQYVPSIPQRPPMVNRGMLTGGSGGGSAQCVVNGDLVTAFGQAVQAMGAQGGTLLLQSPPQSARFSYVRKGFVETGMMTIVFNADLSVAPAGPRQVQVRVDCRPESLTMLIGVSVAGTLLMAMLAAQAAGLMLILGGVATAWMVYSLSKNVPKELAEKAIFAVQMAAQGQTAAPFIPQPQAPVQRAPQPPQQPPPPPPPPQAPEAPSASDVMRKLIELRDMGALTPEEFEAKKAEVLKRL